MTGFLSDGIILQMLRRLSVISCLSFVGAFGTAAEEIATGCGTFDVELPHTAQGLVVYARDFGFSVTNTHNGAAIGRALAEAKRLRASRVELAGGDYRCFDEAGIAVRGFTDFTLDGKGARLVFRRPVRALGGSRPDVDCNFSVCGNTRILIQNLTCDWDWDAMPLGEFARVTTIHVDETDNASYVDYDLVDYSEAHPHPQFARPLTLMVCNPMSEDRRSFRRGRGGWCNGHNEGAYGAKMVWLAKNKVRVWPGVRDVSQAYGGLRYEDYFSPEKNRSIVRAQEIGSFVRLVNHYYGKGCFDLNGNRHLTLQSCVIESCFGFGVHVSGDQRYWQMIDCRFGPPAGDVRLRPVSTTSDAQHIAQSCGFAKYVRCTWGQNLDDTNNFHDGAMLAEKTGKRTFRCVNRVSRAGLDRMPDAEIEVFEEDYAATGIRARVVERKDESYVLDRDLPDPKGKLFLVKNLRYATDNVLFRDCTFADGCMRNLFQGSQITIENCRFSRQSGTPLRFLVEWTRNLWIEGTRATNIVVRNCTFDANQVHGWPVDGIVSEIFVGARPDAGRLRPNAEAVSRVLIEDCSFVNPRGAVLHVASGRNVVFRNNTVDLRVARADALPHRGLCVDGSGGGLTETGTVRRGGTGK